MKKIPVRRCLGCNEGKPKKELLRIVKNQSGDIAIDLSGKMPGRGAYICADPVCFEKAKKAKRFERAFESDIPQDIYEKLLAEVSAKKHDE